MFQSHSAAHLIFAMCLKTEIDIPIVRSQLGPSKTGQNGQSMKARLLDTPPSRATPGILRKDSNCPDYSFLVQSIPFAVRQELEYPPRAPTHW
jgi:hypothetical protein